MAQCKDTGQEFIQDAFSPMVAVLCSHDAELICQKNNLSFVELIQPFCKISNEVQIRDPGNITHRIHNLRVSLHDFNTSLTQPTLVKKLLNEAVSNALPPNYDSLRSSVISLGAYDLQISSSTPWYEAFRECFLQVSYPSDHEFLKHYLACIFVVSSSHADPMDQFAQLTQQQHQQQHQQPNKLPRWFCPNVLRYYVLLHDVTAEQGVKAETVYQSMKATYGTNSCHLLHINSRSPDSSDKLTLELGNMPDPWSQYLPKKQDTSEGNFEALGLDTGVFPTHVQEGHTSTMTQSQSLVSLDAVDTAFEATEDAQNNSDGSSLVIDHPLSSLEVNHTGSDPPVRVEPAVPSQTPMVPDPRPPSQRGVAHGGCLTLSDHDRLRIFINEFITRGLVPWAERMLRTLNEQVTSRKGIHRSFMNISKKWFVGKQPSGQSIAMEKSNVVYTPEAPEMQMRRLADLAFMFQLYEMSYQTYHSVKKDFNSEHAWLHFAGALEMACISVFMQGANSQRQYPSHYMETAITTYLNSCKSSQFATRSTLLSTEALKSKNLYTEAALQFIKMTSEDSDLRSALLLEQAAHCFIQIKQPMVRKYAFHMILAGHRFSKAGQRRHALRSYCQALQVYRGKHWVLAEDHINFTIGRQSFNLKQLENSAMAFKHLLCAESKQSPPQQNAFLREYLFVFKQQLQQYTSDGVGGGMIAKELPQLPLPVVASNATKVLCVGESLSMQEGRTAASSVDFSSDETDNATWQRLEEAVQAAIGPVGPVHALQTIGCYTNRTDNSQNPVCILGESLVVEVRLDNPLRVPLTLTDVTLLWSFLSSDDKSPGLHSNEADLAANQTWSDSHICVGSQVIPEVILQSGQSTLVHLKVVPHVTGELHITSLAYKLGTNSESEATTNQNATTRASFITPITISGKRTLDVQGPRLNSTKEERTNKMYGPDRRLDILILPRMSKLEASFSEFPDSLICGEVRQVLVYLKNSGQYPIIKLHIASTHPEFFTLGDVSEQAPSQTDISTIYDTLTNTSDCDSDEHVVTDSGVSFVMAMGLPGGALGAGAEVVVPMWLRGPESPGNHALHFLFHYQSQNDSPKVQHRVTQHKAVVRVHQSLLLRSTVSRASDIQIGSKEAPSQDLMVSLEVDNINNVQETSITEFSILQVSCVSCQWHLSHLSTKRHSDIKISSGESSLVCLRAKHCTSKPDVKQKVFTNVTFDQHQIHSAGRPCASLYFRSRARPSLAELDSEVVRSWLGPTTVKVPEETSDLDLTLIVLWKAFVVEETGCSVIHGHHYVTLSELATTVCAPIIKQVSVEQPPVKLIVSVEEETPAVPSTTIMSQLIRYSVRHPQTVCHNFSKHPVCRVKVTLWLYNCSPAPAEVMVSTDSLHPEPDDRGEPLHSSPALFWGGCGSTCHVLEANASTRVCLLACVTHGGAYDLRQVAVKGRSLEPTGADWTEQRAPGTSVVVVQDTSSSHQCSDSQRDGAS